VHFVFQGYGVNDVINIASRQLEKARDASVSMRRVVLCIQGDTINLRELLSCLAKGLARIYQAAQCLIQRTWRDGPTTHIGNAIAELVNFLKIRI